MSDAPSTFLSLPLRLFVFLNRWYQAEGQTRFDKGLDAEGDELDAERRSGLAVVDLACGSGEVVECFEEWHRLGRGGLPSEEDPTNSGEPASVTPMTAAAATTVAAPAQQRQQQATTTIHPALLTNLRAPLASRPAFIPPNRRRPAAPATSSASSLSTTNAVSAAGPSSSRAISPAASVTAFPLTVPAAHTPAAKARDALNGGQYASLVAPLPLAPSFTNLELLAVDPFTLPAFLARHPSHEPVPLALSFADVTAGGLPLPKSYSPTELYPVPKYDMVVCSFALNLAEAEDERAERWEGRSKSLAWKLIWELSTKAEWLVVLGANKRPEVCMNKKPPFLVRATARADGRRPDRFRRSGKDQAGPAGTSPIGSLPPCLRSPRPHLTRRRRSRRISSTARSRCGGTGSDCASTEASLALPET